jgi:hypothetical protein
MVYAPYTVYRDMMLGKEPSLTDDEIYFSWLRVLSWAPQRRAEFEMFRQQFPRHRSDITCRAIDAYEPPDEKMPKPLLMTSPYRLQPDFI